MATIRIDISTCLSPLKNAKSRLRSSAPQGDVEFEKGKRSKYEIVDMIKAQRQLLLKEFSRMEDVGDGR